MLPYEIFLPSLRVQLDQEVSESEHQESLLAQLELLDERRLRAAEHVQVYQKRLSKFYQKKVIERKDIDEGKRSDPTRQMVKLLA